MSVHTVEKMILDVKYKCDDCDEPFFSLDSLQSHQAVHEGDNNSLKNKPGAEAENHFKDIVYECNECEASFYNVVSLQCHKDVHSIEEHSSNLEDHNNSAHQLAIHSAEKPLNLHTSENNFKIQIKKEPCEDYGEEYAINVVQTCISKPVNKEQKKSNKKAQGNVDGEKLEEKPQVKSGIIKPPDIPVNSFQPFPASNSLPHTQSNKDNVSSNPSMAIFKNFYIPKLIPNLQSNNRENKSSTSKTNPNQEIYKCDVCDKQFSQNGTLTRHMRIHTGEKSYQCDICGKSFSRNQYLQVHLRTHSGEKPYKCDICYKKCLDRSHLNTHMRIHTGEKPYKCDVCEKLFLQNTDLTRHMRIHTGEKPFKCDLCYKCFSQSSSLKKHKRIHTGEQG